MKPPEESRVKWDVKAIGKMLWELESGLFDSIECPHCGKRDVSVWFTRPAHDEYRTWFICSGCGFESRALNSERPNNFREDRVSVELQRRDEEIIRDRKFPPPKRIIN